MTQTRYTVHVPEQFNDGSSDLGQLRRFKQDAVYFTQATIEAELV